jgi:hypothetical protein
MENQIQSGATLPCTSCCASFEREYLGMPYTPTKEEIRLRELAEEYHRTCEDYDRTICTGPIKDGAIMPAHGVEMSAISRHAQAVRDGLWRHVAPLGFSRQQWMEARRDEGRHYRHNAKRPSARDNQPQHHNRMNATPQDEPAKPSGSDAPTCSLSSFLWRHRLEVEVIVAGIAGCVIGALLGVILITFVLEPILGPRLQEFRVLRAMRKSAHSESAQPTTSDSTHE